MNIFAKLSALLHPDTIIVIYPMNTAGSLPTPPARVSELFGGWNTKVNGTGAFFTDTTTVSDDITVYAQWTNYPEMVWITPGTFEMGSPTTESGRYINETQYTVILTSGFYIAKFLVTQELYYLTMGNNPSYFHGGAGREAATGEV